MEFDDVTDISDAMKALESMSGIRNVRDGSAGSVQAIDFEAFELSRPTNTSNFVFRRMGTQFKGGLLRLPRVSKEEYSETEVREAISKSIPAALQPQTDIRLEPEVELEDKYFYLHIYIEGTVVDALHITDAVSSSYRPI